jgi:3-oxoacyl-[acyl-carrier protein] reductase
MDLGLKGVPAAVAGASRGLGYAVALELARQGARVAICSRDEAAARAAASSITKQTGSEVYPVGADVAAEEGAKEFIDKSVAAFGGLQVLVTNAGGPPPGGAAERSDDEWLAALDLNFFSAVRMVRHALPHLRRNDWGRIVAITSSTVKQPVPSLALSNAARAATTSFLKTLSFEVGPDAITVNCVLPGRIATDRLGSLAGAPPGAGPGDPAFKAMAEEIPLGRVGTPEEFGAVVAFLCSKQASYVSGVSLSVDGGMMKGLY